VARFPQSSRKYFQLDLERLFRLLKSRSRCPSFVPRGGKKICEHPGGTYCRLEYRRSGRLAEEAENTALFLSVEGQSRFVRPLGSSRP